MNRTLEKLLPWLAKSPLEANALRGGIRVDPIFLTAVLILLGWGLVMVTSASMELGERFGNPFFFVIRQSVAIVIGIAIVMLLILRQPIARWVEYKSVILIASLLMLFVVLVPGIGHAVNGANRWISLGPVNIQVSEFARLGVIVWMAGYIATHTIKLQNRITGMFGPIIVIGLTSLLLLIQPDFGTTAVLAATLFAMAWLARAQWQMMVGSTAVLAVLGVFIVLSEQYRIERLLSFSNPFADPFGHGYQLANALIAIGTGGVFGRGLGESIQKLSYLPEAHTDFIFAVLSEELGLVGVVVLMLLYGIIVWRGFVIAQMAWREHQIAGAALAWGISVWLGMQALINMGVNMGVLPTKGLTLPLMSYGGSAIIVALISLGFLMRVYHEAALVAQMREHQAAKRQQEGATSAPIQTQEVSL
ncbi:MAG: putative lipid II flippase FtsW [Halothiobacillus sp. 24-54-40]|jgi:cell division protein FtsW|nr:MAG: putative lipid II flippase FtsW [Halothiobacillus sp. 35-54-62]OYZ86877.1 MAG: putative lipid II flippase FtsW [Halothiobacillus sp. 24-54-40]OZA79568.1 MAG: putative lipid II flippase FtsW [Halothiobacillus sp. 39-53-45]HQS02474.1 putative lipid II flippase FtsW [Halothiobacillus sp.]HQS29093.1 putative lipid II flippase FtsW [Halothiobacillus sp.]